MSEERDGWDDPFFNGSKSKWLNHCRSALRKQWTRYAPKIQFMQANRFRMSVGRFKNGRKKSVWGAECNICKGSFPMKQMQVDHIEPAGEMKGLEGMGEFASRLFCHRDNMQFLCKTCHNFKSIADRWDITYEEAVRDAFYNETVKLPSIRQKRILEACGLSEWTHNKQSRDKAFKTLLKINWK